MPPYKLLAREPQRSEKQPDYCHSPPRYYHLIIFLSSPPMKIHWMVRPYWWKWHTHSGCQTQRNQNMIKKVPPRWPAFIMLKNVAQAGGRENVPMVWPSAGLCMPQYQTARQDVPNGVIVAQLLMDKQWMSDWISRLLHKVKLLFW